MQEKLNELSKYIHRVQHLSLVSSEAKLLCLITKKQCLNAALVGLPGIIIGISLLSFFYQAVTRWYTRLRDLNFVRVRG